jgi:hypothetical protein
LKIKYSSKPFGLESVFLQGVWLEELKFNKYCSTFVLFDKKFLILY